MKEKRSKIQKIGAAHGIVLGLCLSVLYLILYNLSLDLFLKWWITFIKLILILFICAFAMRRAKRLFASEFSFRDAFTAFFVCILLGTLIFTVFNYVLFHEIDMAAGKYIGQESINHLEAQTGGRANVPEEFRAQLDKMRAEDQYGFWYQAKGFVFNLAGYSILGVFLALIFRTKHIKTT